MNTSTKLFLFGLATILGFQGASYAVPITATITAGNRYAFYYGTDAGLTYVGRDELRDGWWLPETFVDIDIPAGQYLYVVAWSDNGAAQAWLGQFVSASSTISSDSSWEYILTNHDLGDGSPAPSPA